MVLSSSICHVPDRLRGASETHCSSLSQFQSCQGIGIGLLMRTRMTRKMPSMHWLFVCLLKCFSREMRHRPRHEKVNLNVNVGKSILLTNGFSTENVLTVIGKSRLVLLTAMDAIPL